MSFLLVITTIVSFLLPGSRKVRGEGNNFRDCVKSLGLSEGDIRKLPCPKKSPKCPGCKTKFGNVKRR